MKNLQTFKRSNVSTLGLMGLLVVLLLPLIALAAPGPGMGFEVVSIDQGVAVLELWGREMADVGAFEFALRLEGDAARVTEAQVLAGALARDGRTAQPLGPVLAAEGAYLVAGAYSYGSPATGIDGDHALATVTVTLAQPGLTTLSLENAALVAPDASVLLTATERHALQVGALDAGWDLFAPCVDLAGQDAAAALRGIQGQYDRLLAQAGPDPATLAAGSAYWLRATAASSLTLGMVGPSYAPTTPLALEAGWQWIGYCLEDAQPVTAALASLAGRYDRVVGAAGVYDPALGGSYQTLTSMAFGEGYLVHLTESGTLTYPAPAAPVTPPPATACGTVARTPYSTLLHGTVWIDGALAPAGTVVEVLTPRDEVAGCFAVHRDGFYGLLPAYGADDGATPGFAAGEPLSLRVNGCQPATASLLWADDKAPHELHVSVVDGACQFDSPMRLFLPVLLREYAP